MSTNDTPLTISSRSDFFHTVPGGPVFRLADACGLLAPGASLAALCQFYVEHWSTIDAHRAQVRREQSLRNLPAQRRNLSA